jgi:antitoxin (DNA-binding transcriptional repressor) of toxin-antitoxin stability system
MSAIPWAARARFAELLDEAERGTPVVIERRGTRYVIRAELAARSPRRRSSAIETLDPAGERGQWRWSWTPTGVQCATRRSRP